MIANTTAFIKEMRALGDFFCDCRARIGLVDPVR